MTEAPFTRRGLEQIDPLRQMKQAIVGLVARRFAISEEKAAELLSDPRPGYGDVALTCQRLAPILRRDPSEIAREISQVVSELPFVTDASELNGFCNIRLSTAELADQLALAVIASRELPYGLLTGTEGYGKRALIEFSSPNAARTLGFHHLRGTALGAAVARLYEARGYAVTKINYLGDFGHNLGLLLWKLDSVPEGDAESIPAARLQQLYIEANQDEASDPDRVKAGARDRLH